MKDALISSCVGLSYQETMYRLARQGLTTRVVAQEGHPLYLVTQDLRMDRVNVRLDRDGMVTEAYIG